MTPLHGKRLREVRLRSGNNQAVMGAMFGVGRTTWLTWESGQIPASRVLEIREKLNLDENFLPYRRDERPDELSLPKLMLRIGEVKSELNALIDELARRIENSETLNPQVTLEGSQESRHAHDDPQATHFTTRNQAEPPIRRNGVD